MKKKNLNPDKKVSEGSIATNLADIQDLLKNPEFGLAHSLQTRSALVMFEFILRKLKEVSVKIEEKI
jgi:hypothetical protein